MAEAIYKTCLTLLLSLLRFWTESDTNNKESNLRD